MPIIMAFDPGGTTGYVRYDTLEELSSYSQGQFGSLNHHKQLRDLLNHYDPGLVVTERFDYVSGKTKVDLSANEYIGVIKLWCQDNKVQYIDQSRSLKDFWDNQKLKVYGLYRPGMPHANDAMRHLLVYLNSINHPALDLSRLSHLS